MDASANNSPAKKLAGGGTSKRIGYIDALKGFAIVCVVLGHLLRGFRSAGLYTDYNALMIHIDNILYSFHMPLFFTISGFLFYRAYCINRANKTAKFRCAILNNVYVYVLFSVIQWIFKMIFSSSVNEGYTLKDLILLPFKPMSPYWYLYVLVIYYILFYLIYDRMTDKRCILVLFCMVSLIGSLITYFINFDDWFSMDTLLNNIMYFALGIYLADDSTDRNKSKITFAITSCVTLAAFIVNIACKCNVTSIPIAGRIISGCIVLFAIEAFKKISVLSNSTIFQLLGRYSLEIYVTHCFITSAFRIIMGKLGIEIFILNVIIGMILSVILPVMCSCVLKLIHLHDIVFKPFSYKIR